MRAPGEEATDAEFFAVVHSHVIDLLMAGRIAEFARFASTVERVLGEADPILAEFLERELLDPVAMAIAATEVPASHILPHLGPRTRVVWSAISR
jgi:hypothetical protein